MNEKDTAKRKPTNKQKNFRPSNLKSRRSGRKPGPRKRYRNPSSDENSPVSTRVSSPHRGLEGRKVESKHQKYFIVVEEKSAKGVENIIFFVEENPHEVGCELKKEQKAPRKKPKRRPIKNSVTSNNSSTKQTTSIDDIHNDSQIVKSLAGMPEDNCDIEILEVRSYNIKQVMLEF